MRTTFQNTMCIAMVGESLKPLQTSRIYGKNDMVLCIRLFFFLLKHALSQAGLTPRNIEEDCETFLCLNLDCHVPAGRFFGNTVCKRCVPYTPKKCASEAIKSPHAFHKHTEHRYTLVQHKTLAINGLKQNLIR